MNIQELTTSEKILLAEQLWESVRAEADNSLLTEVQKTELDARLTAFELDQDAGDSWGEVKQRIAGS